MLSEGVFRYSELAENGVTTEIWTVAMIYQIKNKIIDTLKFNLSVDGEIVAIEPQVFDVLIYLITHRNRLVTRQEMFDNIWGEKLVSEASLSTFIKKIRQVLGDDGKQQHSIKTIHGRGFQFVADINEQNTLNHQSAPHDTVASSATYRTPSVKPLDLPDKPSLAIMDFVDLGVSKEGALFAYGLTTDINATLSRLPNLFITARASASMVSQLALTPVEVSQRLGVHYLVYGQTQYQDKRVKVTLSVVDAINDTEIWSEHFDRSFDDLFQVQIDMANAIAVVIDSAIGQTEIERAFLIPTQDLSAWENYHRGIWHINKTTVKDQQKTQFFLNKAIALDARFSRAYAGLSYVSMSLKLLDMSTNNDKDKKIAYDYATRSIDYCQSESMGYMSLGRTAFFSQEPEKALKYLDQGIQLNPNYAYCHAIKGIASAHAGSTDQALHHLDVAERLSPFDSLLFAMKMAQATSLIRQKKFDEAVAISLQASNYPNAFFSTFTLTAACFQLAGENTKAREFVKKALEMNPTYSVETYMQFLSFSEESTKHLMSNAMQEAGMPMAYKQVSH